MEQGNRFPATAGIALRQNVPGHNESVEWENQGLYPLKCLYCKIEHDVL